ncbi:MAG: hypothetical protein HZB11_02370 [Candidatus Yonathbacteria bacterium]|nr:hypothetical protein [Candidatus Yonathbacteria bacterium]
MTDTHMKKGNWVRDSVYPYLSFVIPLAGGILFTVASILLGNTITGFILWLAIYFSWGFRIVRNTEYLVIERFGKFNRIVHSGPRILCLPGIVDRVAYSDTLRYRELALFADEKERYRVDFKDGSTPVVMKASYRIGPQGNSVEDIDEAIYRFTYTMRSMDEREERIEEILESVAIPQLQTLEIADALLQKDTIAEKVTADKLARSALEAMGVELNPQKGLIIPDITLTPEIIEQRQKKLQGASEADKQKALGLGYARSIKAIIEELDVTWEEARSIYETQRGLEVLETLDANVSFVAPDMKGVQKTIGVGDANPRNHQPKQKRNEK